MKNKGAEMPRFERAVRAAIALHRGCAISVYWMMDNFRLSIAQAKRDMLELERVMAVRRERRADGRTYLVAMPAVREQRSAGEERCA